MTQTFDTAVFLDDLMRLGLASGLGAIVGMDRQLSGQSAGLRTHVLVASGAALFTLIGLAISGDQQVTRVVQGVAAGVGFIGAGAIIRLRDDSSVRGVTTAASIWFAAAMGSAAGMGEYPLAAAAGCIAIFVLLVLRPVSRWLSRRSFTQKKGNEEPS